MATGVRNGDQRASTAFLERTKKESLYNIEKGQNKHGDQIVRIIQVRSIPMPDKEHRPGNLGREACVWKATYRGCCQQHSEMKTSICQENMFLLWLIWFQIYWQLVVWILGLQLQAAHSEWYQFSLFSLVALLWILSFRSPDVLFISWWRSCFADVLFCSLTIPLCVLVFKIMARPKSGLVRNFSGFLFFHPSFFSGGGGFPSPSVFFRDPHSSCMLAGQTAMWFEVRFVVSGALPAAKS